MPQKMAACSIILCTYLVAFQKAALEGVPVYATKDPRALQGWRDYARIGEEVTGGKKGQVRRLG